MPAGEKHEAFQLRRIRCVGYLILVVFIAHNCSIDILVDCAIDIVVEMQWIAQAHRCESAFIVVFGSIENADEAKAVIEMASDDCVVNVVEVR